MVKWKDIEYSQKKEKDICMPKDQGGLGITSTRWMNSYLTIKWIWRIVLGEGCLWLDLIKAKYLQGQFFAMCQRTRVPSSGRPSNL